MSFADAMIRGAYLKWRFGVNGTQYDERSSSILPMLFSGKCGARDAP